MGRSKLAASQRRVSASAAPSGYNGSSASRARRRTELETEEYLVRGVLPSISGLVREIIKRGQDLELFQEYMDAIVDCLDRMQRLAVAQLLTPRMCDALANCLRKHRKDLGPLGGEEPEIGGVDEDGADADAEDDTATKTGGGVVGIGVGTPPVVKGRGKERKMSADSMDRAVLAAGTHSSTPAEKMAAEKAAAEAEAAAINTGTQDNGEDGALQLDEVNQALTEFVAVLRQSQAMKDRIEADFDQLVEAVLTVEKLTDPQDEVYEISFLDPSWPGHKQALADVRTTKITFEDLCRRMVKHVRQGQVSEEVGETVLRVLQRCVTLVDPELTDEEGGAASSGHGVAAGEIAAREAAWMARQVELATYGAAEMVIDVLSNSAENDVLSIKALEMGTVLLKGGNKDVQSVIYEYLCAGKNNEAFFLNMRKRILQQVYMVKTQRQARKLGMDKVQHAESNEDGTSDVSENMAVIVLMMRLMQDLCEGHNLDMQNALSDQVGTLQYRGNNDLVAATVELLATVAKKQTVLAESRWVVRESATMTMEDTDFGLVGTLDMLIEVCQGPCARNQIFLARSRMVDACKTILDTEFIYLTEEQVKMLKGRAMKALVTLLEGRTDSTVHVLLAEKLEVPLLRQRMVQIHTTFVRKQALQEQARLQLSFGCVVACGVCRRTPAIHPASETELLPNC